MNKQKQLNGKILLESGKRSQISKACMSVVLAGSLILSSQLALAMLPGMPGASTGQQESSRTGDLLMAGHRTLFDLLSQQDYHLQTPPSNDNHSKASVFSPFASDTYSTVTASSGVVSDAFNTFRSAYEVAEPSKVPPDPATVDSANILYTKKEVKPHYDYATGQMSYSDSNNKNDLRFNAAVLIAKRRIDPPYYVNDKRIVNENVVKKWEQGLSPVLLRAYNQRNCDAIASSIINPMQSFTDLIDSNSLAAIYKNPVWRNNLATDNWHESESNKKAADQDVISKSVAGSSSNETNTDGPEAPDLSIPTVAGFTPYGRPIFTSFLRSIHQVASAKALSYGTLVSICMARAPSHSKIGEPTESAAERMADHVNQIINPQYLKAIQSQSLNANIKELVKLQGQSLQMMAQLHHDNTITNANLATMNALKASSYGSSAQSAASMNINTELASIMGAGK